MLTAACFAALNAGPLTPKSEYFEQPEGREPATLSFIGWNPAVHDRFWGYEFSRQSLGNVVAMRFDDPPFAPYRGASLYFPAGIEINESTGQIRLTNHPEVYFLNLDTAMGTS